MGAGPALEPMKKTCASVMGLWMAIITLEKVTPVMMSTLSLCSSLVAAWTPTSGLSWSSSLMTVTGTSPSLPPRCSIASMKASY
jgi:hypothetical protein